MNIETIQEEWSKDAPINPLNLGNESIEIPRLHAKYLKYLTNAKRAFVKAQMKYLALRKLRTRYFNGECSQQELDQHGWEQYQNRRPLKSAMESLLEGDEVLQQENKRVEYVKILIYQLEQIVKSINGRAWEIKNAIEFSKFTSGAY